MSVLVTRKDIKSIRQALPKKENQVRPEVSVRKKIIKMRTYINDTNNRKQQRKVSETKISPLRISVILKDLQPDGQGENKVSKLRVNKVTSLHILLKFKGL